MLARAEGGLIFWIRLVLRLIEQQQRVMYFRSIGFTAFMSDHRYHSSG